MPFDPPARIAVLGAGPIGLEVALYARYLGYEVDIYERGATVAANVLQWGHVTLFSPTRMNLTPLGIAAIRAQDDHWESPSPDLNLSGLVFYESYLKKLAQTDLLRDCLQLETEVVAVGRHGRLKSDVVGDNRRGNDPFRILLRDIAGGERTAEADVVIDCTGTYGNHNCLGQGSIPAIGEVAAQPYVEYGLPDLVGGDRNRYLGRHTLVIGSGYSAATVVAQLSHFVCDLQNEGTRVTWITRRVQTVKHDGPIARIPHDRLSARDELAKQANQLASESDGPITHYPGTSVQAVEYRKATDDFRVTLVGETSGTFAFDRIVANVGYRPDNQIYAELQVHECYATGGPMKLATVLLAAAEDCGPVDCLDQISGEPESLLNPEPDFYILGSKSYGRGTQFLLATGQQQIRDVFTIISGRTDLDLYSTTPQLTT